MHFFMSLLPYFQKISQQQSAEIFISLQLIICFFWCFRCFRFTRFFRCFRCHWLIINCRRIFGAFAIFICRLTVKA
ncbi:TPA: hypothetical protein I2T40_06935 [Staphylococcus aureus]|nr:hypothetical protein [Staphylococcus aureus]